MPPPLWPSSKSWDDEERGAYTTLSAFSARLRTLNNTYYGGGILSKEDKGGTSDDEHDALMRWEVELCNMHARSLTALEAKAGSDASMMRFGGRFD